VSRGKLRRTAQRAAPGLHWEVRGVFEKGKARNDRDILDPRKGIVFVAWTPYYVRAGEPAAYQGTGRIFVLSQVRIGGFSRVGRPETIKGAATDLATNLAMRWIER
jgi:hypothetical protein